MAWVLAAVGASAASAEPTFADFQRLARKAHVVLELPEFEGTPEALRRAGAQAIRRADRGLDRIGRLTPAKVTFANTVAARDRVVYDLSLVLNRAYLLKEVSPVTALRTAALEVVKALDEWKVGLDYREDVYRAIRAFANTQPSLEAEAARLLEETLRDYRRAGLDLPASERATLERLRKELARCCTDYGANANRAEGQVVFTRTDLEGLPPEFLDHPEVKIGDDAWAVKAHVTWQFVTVMENARRESTRRRLKAARYQLATEANVPLFRRIVALRAEIARRLGYASWADYQTEPRMARTAAAAREFLTRLREGLQPKFDDELAAMRELKVKDTGDAAARIEHWDWRHYANRLVKQRYRVDPEELRVFFPYEATLQGMFHVFERVFGLTLMLLQAPQGWVDGLDLCVVCDAASGEPLGTLYLDMFPREGKYGHFAQFDLIGGLALPNGRYQRPACALICNFPAPSAVRPSLLSFDDVRTLFHEFGHALHTLLTRAKFGRFSGTRVPGDFVEAPSTMLENWAGDKAVLDTFAADYRNPSRKVPPEVLQALEDVRRATIGTFYRRQLSFGLMDLTLHGPEAAALDPVKVSNGLFADVFLAAPDGTACIASFSHLVNGYDGGYYGYAWADAISADLATPFRNAPDRFLDAAIGRRLREEIYAPGGSRDAEECIRRFLGRERSLDPFLESIGIAIP